MTTMNNNNDTNITDDCTSDSLLDDLTDDMVKLDMLGGRSSGSSETTPVAPAPLPNNGDDDQNVVAASQDDDESIGNGERRRIVPASKQLPPLRVDGCEDRQRSSGNMLLSSPANTLSTEATSIRAVFSTGGKKRKKKLGTNAAKNFFSQSAATPSVDFKKPAVTSENNARPFVASTIKGTQLEDNSTLKEESSTNEQQGSNVWKDGNTNTSKVFDVPVTPAANCAKRLFGPETPSHADNGTRNEGTMVPFAKAPSYAAPRSHILPANEYLSWGQFFRMVNITPFREENTSLKEVIRIADRVMALGSDGKEGWRNLGNKEKAMIAFVVNDGIHHHFKPPKNFHTIMYGVLKGDERYAKEILNLWPCVRKGGDEVVPQEVDQPMGLGEELYHFHLSQYPQLFASDEVKWASIFTGPVKPLLKIQEAHSTACVFMVTALTIFYARCKREGRNDSPNITKCSLNVSKCMRYCLTSQQKYETIFEGFGFVPKTAFEHVFGVDNPEQDHYFNTIEIWEGCDLDDLFSDCKRALQHTSLFIILKPYPGYAASRECIRTSEEKNFESIPHAITITDVCRTKDNDKYGGLVFVLQDCCEIPFKNLGINLVLQQKIKGVHSLLRNINLPKDDIFDISPDSLYTRCGNFEGMQAPPERVFDPKEYYKRGGIYQQRRHMFTNDPEAVPLWDSRYYPDDKADDN